MITYRNSVVQEDLARMTRRESEYRDLKNKSVLVTGATGMLASYCVFLLCYLNEHFDYHTTVYALMRNKQKAEEMFAGVGCPDSLRFVVQDVCEEIALDAPVHYIIHAAGNASAYAILHNPSDIVRTNTLGTIRVLDLAKQTGARVLFTSTREVYGDTPGRTVLCENDCGSLDQTDPRSCYPESKRVAETLFVSYGKQYGTAYVINRIAHVYGPGMAIGQDGRIMSDLIGAAVRGEDIVLHSDGTALRAFCYLTDAVAGMFLTLLKGENGGIYNLANETEERSVKEAAQMLIALFPDKNMHLVVEGKPLKDLKGYLKTARIPLDTARLEALGWKPEVSLEQGMLRTVNSYQ